MNPAVMSRGDKETGTIQIDSTSERGRCDGKLPSQKAAEEAIVLSKAQGRTIKGR